jgi:hypothetical protein
MAWGIGCNNNSGVWIIQPKSKPRPFPLLRPEMCVRLKERKQTGPVFYFWVHDVAQAQAYNYFGLGMNSQLASCY